MEGGKSGPTRRRWEEQSWRAVLARLPRSAACQAGPGQALRQIAQFDEVAAAVRERQPCGQAEREREHTPAYSMPLVEKLSTPVDTQIDAQGFLPGQPLNRQAAHLQPIPSRPVARASLAKAAMPALMTFGTAALGSAKRNWVCVIDSRYFQCPTCRPRHSTVTARM